VTATSAEAPGYRKAPGATLPFQAAEYQRLLAAARRSLERTGGEMTGTVSLAQPTDAERKAVIGVTGQYRDARTTRVTVRLADLDTAVRESTGTGLADLLAGLGGPLRDRRSERIALAGTRDALIRAAQGSPLHASSAWYRDWLDDLTRDGILTRLAGQSEQALLPQAVRVLEHLDGRQARPVPLPVLAADVTGDTKALNHGTALSTLVLRALAIRAAAGRPRTAGERRALWESADVVVDDLASRVLVLNLPAEGRGLGEWLGGAARLGVPFCVTLHQLMTLPLTLGPGPVHVCENPAVLRRAAAELGAGSVPLLCTEGQPSMAFHLIAAAIVRGGGELAYHGDFDWPGIAIARSVLSRHCGRPWRMSAADYLTGVRATAAPVRLTGTPQPTPWDPALGEAMAAAGCVLYEESVADVLITDLSVRGGQSSPWDGGCVPGEEPA
jgi:uncharacterized protein (TIGR02679 family)